MARYRPEGLADDATAAVEDPHGKRSQRPRSQPSRSVGLGLRGWLRWAWRQLTSMRVALILMLLLAAAALPGSFFPQRSQDISAVTTYLQTHPEIGPVLDWLRFFDVYSSPWFAAVYLLLFISLIGCIVPRTWSHARALRANPGRVPARFTRFEVRDQARVRGDVGVVTARATAALGRRFKYEVRPSRGGGVEISAERGLGKESGNLLFHLALVGLLVVTGWGSLIQYRGQAIVVEDDGSMVNAPMDYDTFSSGAWYSADSQEPFRIRLEDFHASFTETSRPEEFRADVAVVTPDGEESEHSIEVNDPLRVDGARVYLTGNGYAPVVRVTDAAGEVAYSGPVLFLPQDENYNSTGVVLVPDANGGQQQLAFTGELFPTAAFASDGSIIGSGFPLLGDPVLLLAAWSGDLGLDDGVSRNLLSLDVTGLEQISEPGDTIQLRPGDSYELPGGQGSIEFSEVRRFVALDVRWDPMIPWMGVWATLAFVGLLGSLFLPRRRLWLRMTATRGGTVIQAAGLARGEDTGLQRELDRVMVSVRRRGPDEPAPSAAPDSGTTNDDG